MHCPTGKQFLEVLKKVDTRRRNFQGYSLYALLFVVALIPMTEVLQKIEVGYQLKKRGNRISHLMLMDDIMLFEICTKEIDTLIKTVRTVSRDIKMEFRIKK